MDILRALFTLATSSKKEGITIQNVGAQARLAVLQIASSNTPLFMTTLSLDIITPASLEHRKSVMQILAFLIRKVFFCLCSLLISKTCVAPLSSVSKLTQAFRGRGEIARPQRHLIPRRYHRYSYRNPRACCQNVRVAYKLLLLT